jgi:hypothetical protein
MSPKERVQFNVRLDGRRELVETIRRRVGELKVSLNDFVASALDNALKNGLNPRNEDFTAQPIIQALETKLDEVILDVAKANQRIANLEWLGEFCGTGRS